MIRTAKAEENEALSSLAMRSKAHWNYDTDFLEACRQDLTYTQQDISHHTVYVVEEMRQVVGFYRLEIRENELELSDLFIEPSKIGQGYGKRLWDHAIDQARQLGFHKLSIPSDPYAESFYLSRGSVRIGEAPSGAIPERTIPLLEFALKQSD